MISRGENIYFRKDQRWEGRYHKGRTINGKIKYGYVYAKTYEEVKEKLSPLKTKSENLHELYGMATITCEEWIQVCWQDLFKDLKPATIASYQHKIKRYFLPKIGKLSLYELNKELLINVVESWEKMGLRDSSRRVLIRLLGKLLKYAEKKRIIEKNICEELPKIKVARKKITALSSKEQDQLENATEQYHDVKGQSVLLALHTGLRIGEIAALKWSNIDFERGVLNVTHTFQRITNFDGGTTLNYGAAKTLASHRIVPMSNKIKHLLKKIKQKASSDYVFSVNEKPCEPRLFTYHFHCIRRKVGLENVHFHQLRHTFATRCLEFSSDVISVSAIMGHASTQMTLDIYADSLLDQRWQVIKSLERNRK